MFGPAAGVVVAGSFAAGLGSLGLVWYLNRYRGSPGAGWFMLTFCSQALWTFGYGAGVLFFDRGLRAAAEALVWIGIAWLGPMFLAFAVTYTGRTKAFRSRAFQTVFVVPAAGTLLAVTHPLHDLLWRQFRIDPLFGLATVRYTIQPAAYVVALVSLATAAVGVLLLVETILTYGPLYRREAVAVGLSTLPPAGATIVWLLGVGPWPALNLAPVMFLPHVALDAYAFVGTHMFETNPTTQRAAEESALTQLENPLLVVDTNDRVVRANVRARDLFDIAEPSRTPIPLSALVGTDLATLRSRGEYDPDRTERVFAVSYTPLTDSRGDSVGGLVVFHDITAERRQRQQLTVLNRVLRHNLRNEMTVVQGRADLVGRATEDPHVGSQMETIKKASRRLLSISEKAREFDRLAGLDLEIRPTDLADVREEVVTAIAASHPEATIDFEVDASATTLRTDPRYLTVILTNLVENAVVHADEEAPTVEVRARSAGDGARVVFEVRDDNPPIADAETRPIREGEETSIRHGSGLGLWIVDWCVRTLDGDVAFEYDEGNVVTVTLPAPSSADPPVASDIESDVGEDGVETAESVDD